MRNPKEKKTYEEGVKEGYERALLEIIEKILDIADEHEGAAVINEDG